MKLILITVATKSAYEPVVSMCVDESNATLYKCVWITSASHAWTIPCAIQLVAAIVITVVVAMVAVVVAALVVGADVNRTVELLLIDVCEDVGLEV